MNKEELEKEAEEYADKQIGCGDGYYEWTDIKQAYLAGATENGFQRHDLRKDPKDLPKKTDMYLVHKISGYGSKSIELIQYNSSRQFWCVDCQNEVVAWYEIPQFEE